VHKIHVTVHANKKGISWCVANLIYYTFNFSITLTNTAHVNTLICVSTMTRPRACSTRGSSLGRGKWYLSWPEHQHRLWRPPQYPVKLEPWVPFHEGKKGEGVMLTTQLYLVPRLKMNGSIPLLPLYTVTPCAGQFYIFKYVWPDAVETYCNFHIVSRWEVLQLVKKVPTFIENQKVHYGCHTGADILPMSCIQVRVIQKIRILWHAVLCPWTDLLT
jgi:hypothetical protein